MTATDDSRRLGDAAVEVLIPHHNRANGLARALQSLREQTVPVGICVIDNASTDGSRTMLEERFPDVRVVALEENLGFGKAVNRGASTSAAEWLVVTNNDVVAEPDFVERLLASGADAVAGCLRSPAGPVESLGVELDTSLAVYDVGHGLADPAEYSGPPPLGPSGGAALYRRATFQRLGGFDERFFAYLEDADLALRLRLAGARVAMAPEAVVWHEHSGTLGARSSAKNELLGYSRAYLLWKYRAALGPGRRARAYATDLVVYLGKAVIDRNLGALRGTIRARSELRGLHPPAELGRVSELPLTELGFVSALRRRLARRT